MSQECECTYLFLPNIIRTAIMITTPIPPRVIRKVTISSPLEGDVEVVVVIDDEVVVVGVVGVVVVGIVVLL
ncbi:MAG: hypothetical protein ACFFEE_13595, partial [Candidatus Thorarchaeota archaeon]